MSSNNLKVTIVYGELKVEFEGSPEDVYLQVVRFLEKSIPTYSLANKIHRSRDIAGTLEKLKDLISYSEGEGIYPVKPLQSFPTSEAILLMLAIRYLEHALGLREGDSASAGVIVSVVGRPMKTISGRLSELVRKGYIKRLERGDYAITVSGLSYLLDSYSRLTD